MARSDQSLSEAHDITGLLFQVVHRVQADFADAVATHDLSVPLARSLLFLEQPRLMKELSAHNDCDASNTTRIVDRLERKGLVVRSRGADRRSTFVTLTDAGASMRRALVETVAERSTVNARLSAADREALRPILAKMIDP